MRYRFGDFTLDRDTRQLLANGDEIHLSPKAFDLLVLLVANRVRALSKAELQERLWPSTFVVETNLATLVAEVRRALGDAASDPTFVRTVYGFGYRFLGEVVEAIGEAGPGSSRGKLWLTLEGRHVPLMDGINVLGRAPDAAIQIDSPGISRYHARIRVERGEATVEDLGSKNGTLLNEIRVTTPRRLVDGDRICLGVVSMTFRVTSPTSPTQTIPA